MLENIRMRDTVINKEQPGLKQGIQGRVIFSLVMRTSLFVAFGVLFVGLFAIMEEKNPLQAAEKWWPIQAFLANVATFVILRYFLRKEGSSFRNLINLKKERLGKDLVQFLWLLPIGFIFGGVPLYLSSYLIFGSIIPPDLMFQPLPMWAALLALILFPISNALVETPTYIGYAQPRIRAATGKLWLAILLAGLALALQHVALPLVLEGSYLLWRFVSFIPLALALGFIFSRTNRLFPIVLGHFVMDLQLVLQVFISSLA